MLFDRGRRFGADLERHRQPKPATVGYGRRVFRAFRSCATHRR